MSRRSCTAALALLLIGAPLAAQPDAAFVAWAKHHAVPIDAAGFRVLDAGIAKARLIGVGESVHEAEPFLSFRLQLLQDLVRRHRVTALVLESGLPEAMAVDDYVRGKIDRVDFDAALPGGYGKLEPIRRTMEWLREWNRGPGRKHPVGVYGADLPNRSGSIVPALDRLRELATDWPELQPHIEAIRPTATLISAGWWKGAADKYGALPADAKAALTADADRLVEHAGRLSVGNRERLEWVRRIALVVEQHETMLRLGAFAPGSPRDVAMADNTLWVLSRLAKGERAVYWAHNAHVQRVPVQGPPLPPGRYASAGMRFAATLGTKYYPIATTYGGSSMDKQTATDPASVDGTLEKVSTKPFLLPLHTGRRPAAVDAWLAEERLMRFQVDHLRVAFGQAFDAVAYFDKAAKAAREP